MMTSDERAAALAELAKPRNDEKPRPRLAPDRYPQRDLFIADILDAAPKSDNASMEHPIFALRAGDKRVRTYSRNGISVTVYPAHQGCATIHDKDLWIYCISQLMEAKNRGREISPTVRFTMHDFLVATNRPTSGVGYTRARNMMRRISGTRIETNIETNGKRSSAGFGLIDSWEIVERESDDRMVAIEVDLPHWLFRAVEADQVLTLSRDYFRLSKPLDRRIYELARKHCGKQKEWTCSIATLHEKTGSTGTVRRFRHNMKALCDSDELPDYSATLDIRRDMITFTRR